MKFAKPGVALKVQQPADFSLSWDALDQIDLNITRNCDSWRFWSSPSRYFEDTELHPDWFQIRKFTPTKVLWRSIKDGNFVAADVDDAHGVRDLELGGDGFGFIPEGEAT